MDWMLFAFPGGRHKALTLGYDDGRKADRRLLDVFNRHGVRGTFFLNAGRMGSAERIPSGEIAALYQGHEVATHGLTHPTLPRCPQAMQVQQIIEDRKGLEALVDYPVRGHAYPNGCRSPALVTTLATLGIDYARTTECTSAYTLPDDFLAWHPTCHHGDRLLERLDTFLALPKAHIFYLFSVWGHSWEFDRDDNWGLIETFCQQLAGHPEIWQPTMLEFFDYQQACQRVQFTAQCDRAFNPNAQSVWLSIDGEALELLPGQMQRLL